MIRKDSISDEQRQYREIVLNKRINHWQKANKMILEHKDVKYIIEILKRQHKMEEPYVTNIAMRIFAASWEVINRSK